MVLFLKMFSTHERDHKQLCGAVLLRLCFHTTENSATNTPFKDSPRDFYSIFFFQNVHYVPLTGFHHTTVILAATAKLPHLTGNTDKLFVPILE